MYRPDSVRVPTDQPALASCPPTMAMPATAMPAEAMVTRPLSANQATSTSVVDSTSPMTALAVSDTYAWRRAIRRSSVIRSSYSWSWRPRMYPASPNARTSLAASR
jgi:hypothetical protein